MFVDKLNKSPVGCNYRIIPARHVESHIETKRHVLFMLKYKYGDAATVVRYKESFLVEQ
jgi:hypothetical protein